MPKKDPQPVEEREGGAYSCVDDLELGLSPEEAQQLSDELQVLAHPIRLQILDILARNEGQVCVCDLEAALPVKQSTVSHHLKLLRAAGLIDCQRRGLWAHYFVRGEVLVELRRHLADRNGEWFLHPFRFPCYLTIGGDAGRTTLRRVYDRLPCKCTGHGLGGWSASG